MTRIASALIAAALAAGTVSAPTEALAGHRDRDLFAAGALGLLGGAIIAGALVAPGPVHAAPAPIHVAPVRVGDAHVAWCARKYRSYSPYDNTWVDRRGNLRNCASPYGY